MENKTEEQTEVRLENTGQIELQTLDLKQYIGKKSKIEKVTEHKGKFGYFIKIVSEIIDTVEGKDGDVNLRASRLFGLQEEKDTGRIGWGEETKLGKFLKKYKVEHYNDLISKEIIVQLQTSDEKTFLAFD